MPATIAKRVADARPPHRPPPGSFVRRRGGYTAVDLLAVVFLVVLALAAVLPAAERARAGDQRVKCAGNLRMIGLAMMMYANDNKGNFPRVQFDSRNATTVKAFTNWKAEKSFPPPEPPPGQAPGQAPAPAAGGAAAGEGDAKEDAKAGAKEDGVKPPEANDVTAAFYLLLKTQEIASDAFVCPESKATPMPFEQLAQGQAKPKGKPLAKSQKVVSNFAGPQHLSYSYQNPYPGKEARDAGFRFNVTLGSDFALAADLNPGGEAVAAVKPDAEGEALKAANSPNHGGAGQNVLYADGHVEFQETPLCGSPRLPGGERDNIYARHLPEGGGGEGAGDPVAGPAMDPFDNVLLPTATWPAAKGGAGDTGAEKTGAKSPKAPKAGKPATPKSGGAK